MVESGDWLTPHFNYEDRWQKPVLYYWLTAATYLVDGADGVRRAALVGARPGLGLVLLDVARRAPDHRPRRRRVAGRRDRRHLLRLLRDGAAALPDLPLAFFITLAHLGGARAALGARRRRGGPRLPDEGPGGARRFPALVLLPIWWRERRRSHVARARRRRRPPSSSRPSACRGTSPCGCEHGTAYLESFFVGDNFERFATDRFNEPRAVLVLPADRHRRPAAVVGVSGRAAVRARSAPCCTRSARLTRRRVAAARLGVRAAALLHDLGRQAAALHPAGAAAAGDPARALDRHAHRRRVDAASGSLGSPAERSTRSPPGSPPPCIWSSRSCSYRARPLFITAYPALTWTRGHRRWSAAGARAGVARGATARGARLPAITTCCAAALLLAVQFGALAGRAARSRSKQMAALVRSAPDVPASRSASYQVFVRNLVFYTRFKQVELCSTRRTRSIS